MCFVCISFITDLKSQFNIWIYVVTAVIYIYTQLLRAQFESYTNSTVKKTNICILHRLSSSVSGKEWL